jgi:hypothetical protein
MFINISWLEWIGYLSSVLVAVSLTMRSIVKLRWYNLLGAGMFSIYGFMIDSMPVGLLNLFIVFANIYYLKGMYSKNEQITALRTIIDDPYLSYYIDFYSEDIKVFFPELDEVIRDMRDAHNSWVLLLLRDAQLAGILLGKRNGATLNIMVDYVTAPYRDMKTGEFVYLHSDLFTKEDIELLVQETDKEPQRKFLKRLGFTEHPKGRFELLLTKTIV